MLADCYLVRKNKRVVGGWRVKLLSIRQIITILRPKPE